MSHQKSIVHLCGILRHSRRWISDCSLANAGDLEGEEKCDSLEVYIPQIWIEDTFCVGNSQFGLLRLSFLFSSFSVDVLCWVRGSNKHTQTHTHRTANEEIIFCLNIASFFFFRGNRTQKPMTDDKIKPKELRISWRGGGWLRGWGWCCVAGKVATTFSLYFKTLATYLLDVRASIKGWCAVFVVRGAGAVPQPCAAFVCVVFVLRLLLEKAETTT